MMDEKVTPQLGDAMFSVISDMESTNVEFRHVGHMIQIYAECLEEELEILKLEKSGPGAYFLARVEALRSLLEVIEIQMGAALKESEKNVDAGYDVLRAGVGGKG